MLFCSEAFIQALIAYLGEASEPNKEEIVAALMQYLKTPSVFTVQNVIGLPAVTILKGHWMHTLLSLFQAGNLADYDKFYAGLPAGTISPADHELLRRKVRLISLAALAAQHINGELSYDAVSKALLIDEAEVEMVVIDGTRARAAMCFLLTRPTSAAIQFKLIEAQMNQLKKVITITRTTYRAFGPSEWTQLGLRLTEWSRSVSDVLAVVRNARLISTHTAV